METTAEFVRLIAKAYYEAALEDIDMHLVVEALEPVRGGMVGRVDNFELWLNIDQYIGQVSDERVLKILQKLRENFKQQVLTNETVRLREEFRSNPDSGWKEFLRIYAESMINFRLNLCVDLSEERFSFPVENESIVEMIRKSSMWALQGRWPEVYDLILYLAEQDIISSKVRAKLYVMAAEVQLYYFYKPEEGVALLRKAEELDPGGSMVICGFGEYYLQKNELDKAKERLQKALRFDPLMAESYIYMGDVFERQNDIVAAEEWYLEATKRCSGFAMGYIRLLRLYGRPDMFPSHEAELVPLLNRAIAVEPEEEYDAYREIGLVYQQNKQFEKAHEWYNRSIQMDNTRMGAYLSKGNAYVAEKKYDQAVTSFQKTIDAAPEAMDGYWEMANFYEQQGEYDKALQFYKLCIRCRKSWEGIIRGKMGTIYRELQQLDMAKKELMLMSTDLLG